MALTNRVVARYRDGRVVKGTTRDFIANRPAFHVVPFNGGPAIAVRLDELKAVFFVRKLEGDRERVDVPAFTRGVSETAYGQKIAVRFPDGELLCGYSLSYRPERGGFFLSTLDARGNNERVFVVMGQGVQVAEGDEADALLKQWSGEAA